MQVDHLSQALPTEQVDKDLEEILVGDLIIEEILTTEEIRDSEITLEEVFRESHLLTEINK